MYDYNDKNSQQIAVDVSALKNYEVEPDKIIYLPHTYDAKEYVLTDNLSSGWHTVKVTKTTEISFKYACSTKN